MKVQMFEASSVGGKEELFRFKQSISSWLDEMDGKINIIKILQNVCAKQSSHIYLVSIWYEKLDAVLPSESKQEEEEKKTKVETPFL